MMITLILMTVVWSGSFSLPVAFKEDVAATQKDVAAAIAKVADLKETEFAAEPRDAEAFITDAISKVRDLEETDFAAEPRDAKAFILEAIESVRDLEETAFAAEPRN